ncbi:hypothetical protein [Vulcaniibacterium tengchongense]|uniref:Uncharacterized protein n=1 Tax=Vulcaniibacterium tengchongense TaxID=1273429 RepID=A0A3N4VBP6_9GAMM|nr:hypothetical protein [Vulcaniibacterium tengchongense]RPE77111.1 hypothetical protein EDC50_2369 [Vulcaniibacterium tengchongense]
MGAYLVPAILALSSLPAFVAAALFARGAGGRPAMPAAARLMRAVGIAILAGAAGLLWAGDDPARRLAVIVALALAVNGLGLLLLLRWVRDGTRR